MFKIDEIIEVKRERNLKDSSFLSFEENVDRFQKWSMSPPTPRFLSSSKIKRNKGRNGASLIKLEIYNREGRKSGQIFARSSSPELEERGGVFPRHDFFPQPSAVKRRATRVSPPSPPFAFFFSWFSWRGLTFSNGEMILQFRGEQCKTRGICRGRIFPILGSSHNERKERIC